MSPGLSPVFRASSSSTLNCGPPGTVSRVLQSTEKEPVKEPTALCYQSPRLQVWEGGWLFIALEVKRDVIL